MGIAVHYQSVGLQGNGTFYRATKAFGRLVGKTVEKIQVNFCSTISQHIEDIFQRLLRGTPVHRFQHLIIEILNANAESREACVNQTPPVLQRQVAGMALYGYLWLLNLWKGVQNVLVEGFDDSWFQCCRTSSTVVYLRDAPLTVEHRQQQFYLTVKRLGVGLNS